MLKIQLTIAINFICSKDNNKEHFQKMHSKSDYIEVMINDAPDEVIEKVFNHFFLGIELDWTH